MDTSNRYRERTLDKISESDVDKKIKIAGWVENIRDHGGVSFVDLRDMYGIMQVVMRDTGLLEGISRKNVSAWKVSSRFVMKKHIILRFLPERLNWKHIRLKF